MEAWRGAQCDPSEHREAEFRHYKQVCHQWLRRCGDDLNASVRSNWALKPTLRCWRWHELSYYRLCTTDRHKHNPVSQSLPLSARYCEMSRGGEWSRAIDLADSGTCRSADCTSGYVLAS